MKDNVSPEEKLLRLIRGQKKKEAVLGSPAVISKAIPKSAKPSLALAAQKYLSFLDIKKIILAGFIISCIYLVLTFSYPLYGLKRISLPKVSQEKAAGPEQGAKEEIRPVDYYLEGTERQIFTAPTASQEAGQPISVVGADLVKDISLIGIIAGETPQAVIEDKKAQKTLYVSRGQFIGELQVEDIQEGKIILSYKGQKFELYL